MTAQGGGLGETLPTLYKRPNQPNRATFRWVGACEMLD